MAAYPLNLRRFAGLLAAVPLVWWAVGCGTSPDSAEPDTATADAELDAFLNELSSPPTDTPAGGQSGARAAAGQSAVITPAASAAPPEKLELTLHRGDRFPLIKTVEQTLVQKSATLPASAGTRLSLTMTITVEDEQPDRLLMRVRYNRVEYSHNVNGHRLQYDSSVHTGAVPHDAQPYAGLVNNGFAFWLGRNNRIGDLVDYDQFLEQCVAGIPAERRQSLLKEIATRFGDDAVANFVDDTIGLLPYNEAAGPDSATQVSPGETWTRESRLMQPVPVHMASVYRLISLQPQTAHIDITGRITAGSTYRHPSTAGEESVQILGGHSLGSCVVDRSTGLPLELDTTRFVRMLVRSADGQQVEQEKTIVTTIRAFPETHGPTVRSSVPAGETGVIRAGAVSGGAERVSQIPTTVPPVNAPVRAAYEQ